MLHFVQFHNPDTWGEAVDLTRGGTFSIATSKSVRRVMGQRIWLLSRTDSPRTYFVACTFVADRLGTSRRRRFRNEAAGTQGQLLGTDARIDTALWWPTLLARTGSFRWGLTEIHDLSIIRGLERLARGTKPPASRRRAPHELQRPAGPRDGHSSGFGDPASNKLVERAAVAFAKRFFRQRGWRVVSVEDEARGFDLICNKAAAELHVEVKGVSGAIPSFVITSGEHRASQSDDRWRGFVVTNARSSRPRSILMTGSQFRKKFDVVPLDYRAVPK